MSEKEFNLNILSALTEYANELIATDRITVKEDGQYSACNIERKKNDMGERLHVDMTGQNERKTLQIGSFTCNVTPYTVFSIICKFEKICGVKGDRKTRFTFGKGQGGIIKDRAMCVDGKGNVQVRKKTLKRTTEHTATDKCGAVYYQVASGGVWYYVQNNIKPERVEEQLTLEFMRNAIKGCGESLYLPIYNALLAELEFKEQGKEVEPTEKVRVILAETRPIETEKPKRTQGARFTFSMCGILPGEKIVFTPEQIEVTVSDDMHIEFCGELFTLSGFCRAFMPEDKRKPSNAYQGTKYFMYNGVTLMKLRAKQVVCVEVETKELATEVKTSVIPHSFAQERTERRSRTTYRLYENDGSKRIFLQQTNIMMMKIISGFSIKNRHEKAKFGKFSSRNVVHVFPLPPPFRMLNKRIP